MRRHGAEAKGKQLHGAAAMIGRSRRKRRERSNGQQGEELPLKWGGAPFEKGIFLFERGNFLLKRGNFLLKRGNFPAMGSKGRSSP
jgi:hypothetical protein